MSSPTPAAASGPDTCEVVDGRTTRWDAHRTKRRADLVAATLRAIRRHGAGVGMDDIAASAGTSKTVFYRHFGDRAGLYRAVAHSVDARIIAGVTGGLSEQAAIWGQAIVGMVRSVADQWLRSGASASGTDRSQLATDVSTLIWGGLASTWD